jgi:MFS family permease
VLAQRQRLDLARRMVGEVGIERRQVAGGGGILGMYLSAVQVDWANWRWLFLLPVLLVAAATVMARRAVPNSREKSPHSFDLVGSLTSVIAVVALIYVLHQGPVHGWTSPVTVAGLLAGVVAAIGFVAWELRRAAPLLDVRLFRDRRLAGGSLALLALFGVQAGIFVVLFPYFQAVLGWSGLRSTLALMPMAAMMMLASGLAPAWPSGPEPARRWRPESCSVAVPWR